jgi:rhodanese-related sulfurtransferase
VKRFTDLVSECLPEISEEFPWDIEEKLGNAASPLILDVREPVEFDAMRIEGSLNIPRGLLESACDYGYEDTVPQLAAAREREIIIVCRSGNRSVLAAFTMQLMGYRQVVSMKTGLRGWNDYELPLVDITGKAVAVDRADDFFTAKLRPEQLEPVRPDTQT